MNERTRSIIRHCDNIIIIQNSFILKFHTEKTCGKVELRVHLLSISILERGQIMVAVGTTVVIIIMINDDDDDGENYNS
jgi:hypothetical protein